MSEPENIQLPSLPATSLQSWWMSQLRMEQKIRKQNWDTDETAEATDQTVCFFTYIKWWIFSMFKSVYIVFPVISTKNILPAIKHPNKTTEIYRDVKWNIQR